MLKIGPSPIQVSGTFSLDFLDDYIKPTALTLANKQLFEVDIGNKWLSVKNCQLNQFMKTILELCNDECT